ncbi:hypothetical protein BTVI_64975 [Pitangus sulphuratus]|nr:hypothetical protein BTVI_64975 [Pitangus sulphuratus]
MATGHLPTAPPLRLQNTAPDGFSTSSADIDRKKIHVAKAQLDLQVARNVGDNIKRFFKYINGNRQYRNTIGPLHGEDGHFTNRDRDKTEVFNASFASVFNTHDGPRGSQCPELEDHDCRNDQLPVNPKIVWDLLLQMGAYKSMGPDGIHPRILKGLTDVITQHLLMIFEQSWESREVPANWKLANVVLIFKNGKKKDPRNCKPVSLTSVPSKGMEKIILGGIEKYLNKNTVIGHSQHGFMRGKYFLPNLISFYDKGQELDLMILVGPFQLGIFFDSVILADSDLFRSLVDKSPFEGNAEGQRSPGRLDILQEGDPTVTSLVDEEEAVDVVYLDFSQAFDTVSHSIFLEKWAAQDLDGCTVHWVKNCLDSWTWFPSGCSVVLPSSENKRRSFELKKHQHFSGAQLLRSSQDLLPTGGGKPAVMIRMHNLKRVRMSLQYVPLFIFQTDFMYHVDKLDNAQGQFPPTEPGDAERKECVTKKKNTGYIKAHRKKFSLKIGDTEHKEKKHKRIETKIIKHKLPQPDSDALSPIRDDLTNTYGISGEWLCKGRVKYNMVFISFNCNDLVVKSS